MIYTSYFAKLRALPGNVIPISICGKAPDWYKGLQYKRLAPKYGFFMKWKEDHDENSYIEHFHDEVLRDLRVEEVMDELTQLIPDTVRSKLTMPIFNDPDLHIALICYENPLMFCHRHLVADWLERNGINCSEFCFNKSYEEDKT